VEAVPAKTMLRYQVQIDGKPHTFRLGGDPVSADGYRPGGLDANTLEFWAPQDLASYSVLYTLQVFSTGEPVPEHARYLCSTGRLPNGCVWHLFDTTYPRNATRVTGPAATAEVLNVAGRAPVGATLPDSSPGLERVIRIALDSYPGDLFDQPDALARHIAAEMLRGY
jgi:hypothetical protein